MIREKSGCVIFAHAYLLMSQTSQTASRTPSPLPLPFGLVKVARRSSNPVDWQLLLALFRGRLSDDITGHHASWRASDDRVATFVVFSLSTTIKSGIVSDIDNFLQFSPTSEKDSEKDVDVVSRTLNSFLCEWFPNVANFSHGVNLGLLPWPDSRSYSARNWVRRK